MKENNVSRRDFVKTLGVMGVGSVVGASQALAQSNAPAAAPAGPAAPVKVPTRIYGKTGVPVSMLALGGIFDIVSNQLVLQQALNWGVTYWDTAAGYNGGRSEGGIGMFLEKNPQARKDLFIVTKHEGGDMTSALNQSLEKLKNRLRGHVFPAWKHRRLQRRDESVGGKNEGREKNPLLRLQHSFQHGPRSSRRGEGGLD